MTMHTDADADGRRADRPAATLRESIADMLDQRRDQLDQRRQAAAEARDRAGATKAAAAAALGEMLAAHDAAAPNLTDPTNPTEDTLLSDLAQHMKEKP